MRNYVARAGQRVMFSGIFMGPEEFKRRSTLFRVHKVGEVMLARLRVGMSNKAEGRDK